MQVNSPAYIYMARTHIYIHTRMQKQIQVHTRASIYIYIYIYIYISLSLPPGELVSVPRFGLSRVSFCTTSRVRNCTSSWGNIFTLQKKWVLEDCCVTFWCQLVFCVFCSSHQLVTSFFLAIIFPYIFASFQKAIFQKMKNAKLCFINTINIVVLNGVFFQHH